jgi:hypothetical protein
VWQGVHLGCLAQVRVYFAVGTEQNMKFSSLIKD